MAYHGQSLAWHEANFEKHHKAGWVPANVSCLHKVPKPMLPPFGKEKYRGFYLRPDMTLQGLKMP